MGLPVSYTMNLAAAAATGIALSQALAAAGPLTLNGTKVVGGVAILDRQRRVIVTSGGNDLGVTWTVTGTNQGGAVITDSFAGASGAAATSNLDFLTVTSIVGSAAAATTVTAGTSTTGSSPWRTFNWHVTPFNTSIQMDFTSGSVTATIEYTLMDPNNLPSGVLFPPVFADGTLTGKTSNTLGVPSYTGPLAAMRTTVTTGTGTMITTYLQSDISGA